MQNNGCMYCEKGEELDSLMAYICDVDGFPLYLNRNQAHRGRLILACDAHIPKIADLSQEKAASFFLSVHKVTQALTRVYNPDQINIGMYGDTVTHVHCHIVPKYRDEVDWNGVFQMNPQPPVRLSDEETEKAILAIREAL